MTQSQNIPHRYFTQLNDVTMI